MLHNNYCSKERGITASDSITGGTSRSDRCTSIIYPSIFYAACCSELLNVCDLGARYCCTPSAGEQAYMGAFNEDRVPQGEHEWNKYHSGTPHRKRDVSPFELECLEGCMHIMIGIMRAITAARTYLALFANQDLFLFNLATDGMLFSLSHLPPLHDKLLSSSPPC